MFGLTRFFAYEILFLFEIQLLVIAAEYNMVRGLDEHLSSQHKITAMLKTGRDQLREKYRVLMNQRRAAENQVRMVEKSRAMWRERAEIAEAKLRELSQKKEKPQT